MSHNARSFYEENILSEESFNKITTSEKESLFSLFFELRTLLYLGVLLFATGLSIIVYQNIDTIGHQAVLAMIAAGCAGCLYYSFKNAQAYTNEKVNNQPLFLDYVLLTGCLLFLIFEGYIQFEYHIFGSEYSLAIIVPTVLFFTFAYRFDHLSLLSMAIAGLASWAGIVITPLQVIDYTSFTGYSLIFTAELLGIALAAGGWVLARLNIKAHFFHTYINFATNMLFVSTLAGLFMAAEGERFAWFAWLILLSVANAFFARQEKSFYFLLVAVIYTYAGLTYLFFKAIDWDGETLAWLGMWYFIASCAVIIYFLVNYKKIAANI